MSIVDKLTSSPTFIAHPNGFLPHTSTSSSKRALTPRRRIAQFHARITDSLPSYRIALLHTFNSTAASRPPTTSYSSCSSSSSTSQSSSTSTSTSTSTSSPSRPDTATASVTTNLTTTTTAVQENKSLLQYPENVTSVPDTFSSPSSFNNEQEQQVLLSSSSSSSPLYIPSFNTRRFSIETAQHAELYTAADIRCEAFYCSPNDAHYHPVRRREIYMAMQSRVNAGTCCIVMLDHDPPSHWRSLATERGLVVATLDVTLHRNETGRRKSFDDVCMNNDHNVCAYISSMAVRQCWQGRGFAQQMLTYTANLVRESGVPDLYLHVDWDNSPAVHVYSKHGFQVVTHHRRHWIHTLAKPEHTLMHLRLSSSASSSSS